MSAVTYHGEYPEGQEDGEGKRYIEQYGYTFVEGKSVDVKEKDLLAKFAGNRFFKVPESDKDEIERGKGEAEKAELEATQAWLREHKVPFHHRANLDTLKGLRADYEAAEEKAAE